jgi:hypothetical protein
MVDPLEYPSSVIEFPRCKTPKSHFRLRTVWHSFYLAGSSVKETRKKDAPLFLQFVLLITFQNMPP